MPIEVRGPDGSINSFPDGTPDDVIAGAMRKAYPPADQTFGETIDNPVMGPVVRGVERLGRAVGLGPETSVGVGVRQGVADVANIPRALGGLMGGTQRFMARQVGNPNYNPEADEDFTIGGALREFPSPESVNTALFGSPLGPRPPRDNAERYTRAAARGATGALGLGGASPIALLTGVSGSMGAEAASQAFPESKWAPVVGGLLSGGLAAGTYNFMRPTTAGVARNYMTGINNTRLQMGEDLQRSSIAQGLGPLTPGQALNNRGLLQVERLTEQSAQGGPMQEMYQARGPATFGAIQEQATGLSPLSPRQGQQVVQNAADRAIQARRNARSSVGGPEYQAAFEDARAIGVDPTPVFNALTRIGDNNPALRGMLDRMANTVLRDRNGYPITDLEQLQNGIKMDLSTRIAEATTSGDRALARSLTDVQNTLLRTLDSASSQYARARETWARLSVPVTELEQGLVGSILDQPTLKSQAKVFLDPTNETARDVAQAGRALQRANPEAVPVLVKNYINTTLQRSAKSTRKDPSRVGGEFVEQAIGPEGLPMEQANNLQAAMQLLPDGQTRWRAFQNLNAVLRAQARRLQTGSPTAQNQAIQEELRRGGGEAVGRAVMAPLTTAKDWLENARLTGNYADLAEIFSSPNSIEQLRALAREPNIRRREVIVNELLIAQRPGANE